MYMAGLLTVACNRACGRCAELATDVSSRRVEPTGQRRRHTERPELSADDAEAGRAELPTRLLHVRQPRHEHADAALPEDDT